LISLSLLEWSDLVTSLVGLCRLCPCTVLGWLMSSLSVYCPRLAVPLATFVMSLGLCRPEPCTLIVSDIYVGVVCCYVYG